MAEGKERLAFLLEKWFNKDISVEQEQELAVFMTRAGEYQDVIAETLASLWDHMPDAGYNEQVETMQLADSIIRRYPAETPPPAAVSRIHFLKTTWFRYAAVILLLLGTSAYFWMHQQSRETPMSDAKPLAAEIPPGTDGAVLTLADGSQVVLDSLGNGIIATQNGSRVVLKNGRLAYDSVGLAAGEIVYNTITTHKGRQFSVVLMDGTKVWLNAASSLRYPTVFSGKERQVAITGEAYFEVAKDRAKPFLVKISDAATVEVLGTSFNVNAYQDEPSINTTLLEGLVRVAATAPDGRQLSANPAALFLKPGQQAQIVPVRNRSEAKAAGAGSIKLIEDADIDKVMAWKNGAFNFDGASLAEVMRQLERWYDIQVIYEKGVPDIHFAGKMSRGVSLTGLITALEDFGVNFRIEEGRRLVVTP